VQDLIDRLGDFGEVEVEELAGVEEHMQFKLPRVLAGSVAGAA
jgi:4-hydroxy-3-methylbut-2-en-1-yl diphosphate reductase